MTTPSDLSYFIPHHGRSKISLSIPESFDLYLCPPSCARRVSIRALRNDTRNHMGFLYLSEADVAAGCYESALGDAVAEVLETLPHPPRAFFIHVNCIDDFLGTDEAALLADLHERFPFCAFAALHMNPIAADQGLSTGLRIHERLYSMLQPTSHTDQAVNLVGNFVDLDRECELSRVLHSWGIDKTRQLFSCRSFEEYEQLAASRLNIVLSFIGTYAAEAMRDHLGIPFLYLPITYSLPAVCANYQLLGQTLGQMSPHFDEEKRVTQRAIETTRAAIGDIPLAVDSSATMQPFALAKALLDYGFNVRAIFALHLKDHDATERRQIQETHPDIAVVSGGNYEYLLNLGLPRETICIGFDCAYLLKTPHFVDIQKDEGMFGFYAIQHLMDTITNSLTTTTRWE